jgi:uncharacterized protein
MSIRDDPVRPENMELERYTFVLLRRGPRALDYSDEELDELQAGHLAFLGRMSEAGHRLLGGPFDDQEDETKRGFSLYRTGLDETRRLIEEGDPSVRAGRMSVEVMSWLTPKGALDGLGIPVDGDGGDDQGDAEHLDG